MTAESLKEAIKRELPALLREDPGFRDYVLELTRQHHPTRSESSDWFNQMMDELRRDREEQTRKWEEDSRRWWAQERKWEEQTQKWEEQERKWEEDSRRWWAQERKWEEQTQKWEEQKRRWEEDSRKWWAQERKWEEQTQKWEEQKLNWEESNRHFDRVHEEIMAQAKKVDRSIGALGSRWGMQSEAAFRKALAGILEENFDVQVLNVNEFDDEGVVFGRPEQIELDIIIKNGLLLICELKSSIDKAGMYSFERKARFYEERHQRKAQRLIVISPMVDPRARQVAERLGIELYHDSVDVRSLEAEA
ncbi:PD-(D/E)XK nuclease family protein [Halochromatium glycolicum]|uniref:DUF3782 domain-containing protein n=1 Tax=Halochromatium glycolicum TaxID=85075 RepID=A0AAJ0U273_9GAMM|nr:DUF3782 domain-containing protein [Halochromatium glycolicum]MBK1703929.1 hypothetical protein [Halochromatium glycolicum]